MKNEASIRQNFVNRQTLAKFYLATFNEGEFKVTNFIRFKTFFAVWKKYTTSFSYQRPDSKAKNSAVLSLVEKKKFIAFH
jgi:hypothetical protein